MKKNTRKGFTITELVIVIAVIAILAAVLIPTFSSIIKKANNSAILQEAKNMYTNYVSAVDYVSGEEVAKTAVVKVVKGDDTYYVDVLDGSVKEDVYSESEKTEADLLGKVLIEEDDAAESGIKWEKIYCAEGKHDNFNNVCSKCGKELS